jgi:hypothetical protein
MYACAPPLSLDGAFARLSRGVGRHGEIALGKDDDGGMPRVVKLEVGAASRDSRGGQDSESEDKE